MSCDQTTYARHHHSQPPTPTHSYTRHTRPHTHTYTRHTHTPTLHTHMQTHLGLGLGLAIHTTPTPTHTHTYTHPHLHTPTPTHTYHFQLHKLLNTWREFCEIIIPKIESSETCCRWAVNRASEKDVFSHQIIHTNLLHTSTCNHTSQKTTPPI